jgi:hypothetical protein
MGPTTTEPPPEDVDSPDDELCKYPGELDEIPLSITAYVPLVATSSLTPKVERTFAMVVFSAPYRQLQP